LKSSSSSGQHTLNSSVDSSAKEAFSQLKSGQLALVVLVRGNLNFLTLQSVNPTTQALEVASKKDSTTATQLAKDVHTMEPRFYLFNHEQKTGNLSKM
jgi:hypothetical protein